MIFIIFFSSIYDYFECQNKNNPITLKMREKVKRSTVNVCFSWELIITDLFVQFQKYY